MTPTIIEHPSPNHSPRRAGVRVDTVVIHHTASWDDAGTLAWMCSRQAKASAHYMVGSAGDVYRLVPEARTAWHAGKGRLPWETCPEYNFNHRSIGIEVVNPGDGVTPFTEAQYAALAWLVSDIVRRLGGNWTCRNPQGRFDSGDALAVTDLGRCFILGHRDVAPGRETDPADNFDWGRIRKALAGGPDGHYS